MLEPSHAWQQATAANNIIQAMTPRPSLGHTSLYAPPLDARMHGHPKSRMTEKRKLWACVSEALPQRWQRTSFKPCQLQRAPNSIPCAPRNTIRCPHALKRPPWLCATALTLPCQWTSGRCSTAMLPRQPALWENHIPKTLIK